MTRLPHTVPAVHWCWRYEFYGEAQRVRVWRNDWPGDRFEIFAMGDWVALQGIASRIGLCLVQSED